LASLKILPDGGGLAGKQRANLERSSVQREPFDAAGVIRSYGAYCPDPDEVGVSMKQGKPLRRNTPMDQYRSTSAPVAKLGPEIRAKIGQQLHKIYAEVVNQGVPQRFAEILRGLNDSTDGGAQNERT